MSDKAEERRQAIDAMEDAVRQAGEADELTFVLVLAIGDGGHVTYLRAMEHAEPGDLRQAAGQLLGYATKLANIAERMEDTPPPAAHEEKPS